MHKKLIAFTLFTILITFSGIKFGILSSSINQFETSLSNTNFVLWIVSLFCLSIGALLYKENEKGYLRFAIANFIGLALSYYIGYSIGNFNLGNLSLIISALLFVFHSQLKNKSIIGILCVAFCIAFSILIYGVFELVTFIKQEPEGLHRLLFSIITDYSIYIFLLIIPLAGIYNLKNSNTLHNQGKQTLEHLFGFSRSLKTIGVLLLLPTAACAYYLHTYMYQNSKALMFGLFFLMGPLLIAVIKCFSIEKNKESKTVLLLLQTVLITSAFSLFIFRLTA